MDGNYFQFFFNCYFACGLAQHAQRNCTKIQRWLKLKLSAQFYGLFLIAYFSLSGLFLVYCSLKS